MITDTVQDRMERRLAGCLQRVLDSPSEAVKADAQDALLAYDLQQDNRSRAQEAANARMDEAIAADIKRFFLREWRF